MVFEEKIKASLVVWLDNNSLKWALDKSKDDIEWFKRRISSSAWIKLATNLADLRLKLKWLKTDFKKVTSPKRKLEIQSNIEVVKKRITQANRELTNFARTGDKTQSVLGKNFTSMKSWFDSVWASIKSAFLQLFAVATIIQKITEAFQFASQIEDLRWAFDRLAGSTERADAILKQLRISSQGTVSDLNLIKSANKSLALGVATDAESIGTLLEIARLKGKAFGLTTTEAFNDIVTGLWRASPLILDNLGIVIDASSANEVYAKSIGKTTKELTKSERAQALTNAVVKQGKEEMEQAGEVALSTSERWAKLWATFDNVLTSVGKWLVFFILKSISWFKLFTSSLWVALQILWNFIRITLATAVDWVNRIQRFLSGSVSAFRAVWKNIGSAFWEWIRWVLELAINWVIRLVEWAINTLLIWVRAISKLPWVRDLFWWDWIQKLKFDRVDFWVEFDFVNVWDAFSEWLWGIEKTSHAMDAFRLNTKLTWNAIDDAGDALKDFNSIKFGDTSWWVATWVAWWLWLDDDSTSSGWGGSSGESAEEKKKKELEELEKHLESARKKREALFGKVTDNLIKKATLDAKDWLDILEWAIDDNIKKSETLIKNLESDIKLLVSEIAKISWEILSANNSLLERYVDIKAELQEWDLESDVENKLREELKLLEANTDAEERKEALRQAWLSETQALLEKIEQLELDKKTAEEKIVELEAQKEAEKVILEQYQQFRNEIEESYTAIVRAESFKRRDVIAQEAEKMRQLIALQKQAWFNAWTADVAWQSTVNDSRSVNNIFNTTVNSQSDENKFLSKVADASDNLSLGNK